MEKKILLVVNPVAGKGTASKDLNQIKENFEMSGFEVETKITTPEHSAEKIVANPNSTEDIIVAVGGDGTLNEVVNGITKSNKDVKLGFIPYGTTNDFARTLNIPTDRFFLSKNINDFNYTKCDTGKFNEKYFNYVSAFGVFAETSFSTSRKEKNKFGRLAYIKTGTKNFIETNEQAYHLKVTLDNEEIEGEFEYGSVSNSKYIGGFQLFKENEIDIDDGEFEVILIKKTKNKAELLRTYTKLAMQVRDENVIYAKSKNITIQSDQEMVWSLDGEEVVSGNRVEINNLKNNISILTL